jgi:hypothetical protein
MLLGSKLKEKEREVRKRAASQTDGGCRNRRRCTPKGSKRDHERGNVHKRNSERSSASTGAHATKLERW